MQTALLAAGVLDRERGARACAGLGRSGDPGADKAVITKEENVTTSVKMRKFRHERENQ